MERALLNERVRNINNTITMATCKRDTCMNTLSEVFPKEIMEECARLIFLRREAYYIKVKNRQIAKLEWLCQKNRGGHPNIHHGRHGGQGSNEINSTRNTQLPEDQDKVSLNTKERWVVNLSSQPLTQAERKLLTHDPNFALTSRSPHHWMCNCHWRSVPETGERWGGRIKRRT